MPNKNRNLLMDILESSVAKLQQNEEMINDLNVFPVPDGDTGSNMLATLISAWKNVSDASVTDVEVMRDFARGALLGARGNSGVITSQIIKGIAVGIEKVGKIKKEKKDIRIILRSAREYAYKSVSNPVEGTILSVIKALDENYNRDANDLRSVLKSIIEISNKATEYTPNQLEVLKEAGVVDSGAKGLCLIFEGMLEGLMGNPLRLGDVKSSGSDEPFIKADPNSNIGYCTEFILTLKNPKNFKEADFKKVLTKDLKGDSLVMIKEEDILKVHVHVKKPGEVFNAAQKFGEFSKIKADNMTTQTSSEGHMIDGDSFEITKKLKDKELAIVVISNGEGLDKEFKDLGVNKIINGGQTMNPSVEDFVKVINKLNYKNIVILPNNSNIILAAEKAKELIEDKNIFVIPTKTMQQGIVALYNINKEMYDFHGFQDSVIDAIKNISEGQITVAVRDTEMNGVKVKKGNFIALKGKKILSSTTTLKDSSKDLIEKVIKDKSEVITLIYNKDVSSELLKELEEFINEKDSSIEVETIFGGQAVYHLLVFGEK